MSWQSPGRLKEVNGVIQVPNTSLNPSPMLAVSHPFRYSLCKRFCTSLLLVLPLNSAPHSHFTFQDLSPAMYTFPAFIALTFFSPTVFAFPPLPLPFHTPTTTLTLPASPSTSGTPIAPNRCTAPYSLQCCKWIGLVSSKVMKFVFSTEGIKVNGDDVTVGVDCDNASLLLWTSLNLWLIFFNLQFNAAYTVSNCDGLVTCCFGTAFDGRLGYGASSF